MGSSSSQCSMDDTPGSALRLQNSGLHFTTQHLKALNHQLTSSVANNNNPGVMSEELESIVESLVQQLVDCAGETDPRFRCEYLVALHKEKWMKSKSLEYLVTLDGLSDPKTSDSLLSPDEELDIQEGPAGYARIRLTGKMAEEWSDMMTPTGFYGDKLVERWVELVASCGGAGGLRATCPGRILSARAAHGLLECQGYNCYFRLDDPTTPHPSSLQYRLAIVAGAPWVRLRLRWAGAAAEAKLALAVRRAGWPRLADWPARVPLVCGDALLHYGAGRMGYYLAAGGPPSCVACPERQASWQLWHPASEAQLERHHAEQSCVARVARLLNVAVDRMRDGAVKPSLRLVSRYMMSTLLRFRLEEMSARPQDGARAWSSQHLAHQMLVVLDRLLGVVRTRAGGDYVYSRCAGVRRCVRGGARAADRDWRSDAECLQLYLALLHSEAVLYASEETPPSPSERLESAILCRWQGLMRELTWSARSTGRELHTPAQLQYIAHASRELVLFKKVIVQDRHTTFRTNLLTASTTDEPIENLIHILAILLDQARDLYLNTNAKYNRNLNKIPYGKDDADLQEHKTSKSKKLNKMRDYYDVSSACLIDAIRRDEEIRNEDLSNETVMVKVLLKWLHKAAKDDKKYLGPVLKPYLELLFISSHECCWFLEEFVGKSVNDSELVGFHNYCSMVIGGQLEPRLGLLEAAKNYAWAKSMVEFCDGMKMKKLKLVFAGGGSVGLIIDCRLPGAADNKTMTLSGKDKSAAKMRLAQRCLLNAFTDGLCSDQMECEQQNMTELPTTSKSEEFLSSRKNGNFWRNGTKPDIVTSNAVQAQQLFETMGSTGTLLTTKRKYHTLKSLVYSGSVDNVGSARNGTRSAGSTIREKEPMCRPSILETLDFINGIKSSLNVEDSAASDVEEAGAGEQHAAVREAAPLNQLAARRRVAAHHKCLGNVVHALVGMHKFSILQELCNSLPSRQVRLGALYSLHRLARGTRRNSSARSLTRSTNREYSIAQSKKSNRRSESPPQRYRRRPPDYVSGDERAPPRSSRHSKDEYSVSGMSRRSRDDQSMSGTSSRYQEENGYSGTGMSRHSRDERSMSGTSGRYREENGLSETGHWSREELDQIGPVPQRMKLHARDDRQSVKSFSDVQDSQQTSIYGSTSTIRRYHENERDRWIYDEISKHNAVSNPLYQTRSQTNIFNSSYTGIISPKHDEKKMNRNKFSNKRSKSLGRSFSGRKSVLEAARYNITLGSRSGRHVNEVVANLIEYNGEAGLDYRGAYFQRQPGNGNLVADAYRVTRVTVD